MTDPVTIGLLLSVGLILAVVVALLFHSSPLRHAPQLGTADAFHLLLLGRTDEARDLLAQLVRDGRGTPEAHLRLGSLLRADGEPQRALALHQGLLVRPELGADLRRLTELEIAEDHLELGWVEEAERRLSTLDQHLIDEALLLLHARALHRLGRHEDAADALLRRIKLHAGGAEHDAARYLAEIAREAMGAGESSVARGRARRAQKLDPSLAAAYVVDGDAALSDGNESDASTTWMAGLRVVTDSREALLVRVVELAFRQGRLERTLEELEELRLAHPSDAALWRAVADLRLRRGDLESFFLLIEDPPSLDAIDMARASSWLRYAVGHGDEASTDRLLRCLPESFGPSLWACASCGHNESEPRSACMRCGRLDELQPQRAAEVKPLLGGVATS